MTHTFCLLRLTAAIAAAVVLSGCGSNSSSPAERWIGKTGAETDGVRFSQLLAEEELPPIVQWAAVTELPKDVAILESVFWEPDDTISLRAEIASTAIMKDAAVLEIGTGSGLIALCCLQAGAAHVIATDLNPSAVKNVLFNAREMGFAERLDARLVPGRSPGAWTVIEPTRKFDLIISNPPWEDSKPVSVDQFALYDPGFELLTSLMTGARQRLKPDGRLWLAYGCVTAIRKIQQVAAQENLSCVLRDERSLDTLPELFLPGMLIEITVP